MALKPIRAKCLDCSGQSYKEVELCPIPDCPLWPYRFGMSPQRAKRNGKVVEPEAYPSPVGV